MQPRPRDFGAGSGWLISTAAHAVLLSALSMTTLARSRPHAPVWIDTRLESAQAPWDEFTVVSASEPILPPSTERAAREAQSVAARDPAHELAPFDFPSTANTSSPFPESPAELSVSVRLENTDSGTSQVKRGHEAGTEPQAVGNGQSAGFFGVEAQGERFVYIVDASRSMRGDRFAQACEELVRSVSRLSPRQGFYVFFFNSSTFPLFYPATAPSLVPATVANKRRLIQWVGSAQAAGSTYPKTALFTALAMQPDAIFVLSDGKFPERTVRRVTAKNEVGAVIHSIGFGKRAAEEVLRPLAEQNGGSYRFVP